MLPRMPPVSCNCLNWRKRFCDKLILWLRNLKVIALICSGCCPKKIWPDSNQTVQSFWLCSVERLCWMKCLLNWMTNKPCIPQESWKELNEISPDKVWVQVQGSLHTLLHTMTETMYIWNDIMLVSQNSEHNGVGQCNLRLTSLTNHMCPSLMGALPNLTGNEHGKIAAAQRPPQPPALLVDGKETKNHIDGMNCVLSLQNARKNTQTNTGREWISIPCLHIYCRALNSNIPSVQRRNNGPFQ